MDRIVSPLQGTVVAVEVAAGDEVGPGTLLVVIESMKMEHGVSATTAGRVAAILVVVGAAVTTGDPLVDLDSAAIGVDVGSGGAIDSGVRPAEAGGVGRADLAEVRARHARTLDEGRPEAVGRRRARGRRTARENVADLVDPGSFVEYAPLVMAAQRRRRSREELIERTPADGLVGGVGTIDGRSVVAMSYDYTVLAGTQGLWNHLKKDRLFELAERLHLPVVLFAEGGGGRPGDTDGLGVSGLDCMAFHLFGRLSGRVPLVGIASGFCFAGNAALLGCCDLVIATPDAHIGMGGPAMIEGGGLGTYAPEEIGPVEVHVASGVVDVVAADEAEAVATARRWLGLLAGPTADWECADQERLRDLVPERRTRAYDIRAVIAVLADTDSVLEVRAGFGRAMVTALVRVEGRTVGVVANDPGHLGGAIDADAADKAARFLGLCDTHAVPVVFLCDTPGFMVGPASEAIGAVRRMAQLFVIGANLSVPCGTVVLRKGYGLGAQAMAAGSLKAPMFCVAWPTGEFGGMNLEGAVQLGMRRELDAIADPVERETAFTDMVARMYEHGRAVSTAEHFEIDDVIDPADTRRWIAMMLRAASATSGRGPVSQ